MAQIKVPEEAWKYVNEKIELQDKEISELKAKNKELEAARNDLFNQGIYLMEDQVKLLDALEETNNYLAKGQHGTEKGSLIARNKNIITKYRG